jgi:hypothetical protein
MLSALIIVAFTYPIVYGIRRFILKEPKFTGEVDGSQDTRPIAAVAVAVAVGLGIVAVGIQLALGARDTGAMTTTMAGTLAIGYYFMRK